MKRKKLNLNKQRISVLSKEQSQSLRGGGSQKSTNRNFTCCLCTGGDDGPKTFNEEII